MNEQGFFDRKQPEWRRLATLCDMADRSPRDLSQPELKELVGLYRKVSSDLSLVRTVSTNPSLTVYLNDLAARAYGVIYREPRKSLFTIVQEALVRAAIVVRRRGFFVIGSFALFFGSAAAIYLIALSNGAVMEYFRALMGDSFSQWQSGRSPNRTSSESAMMTAFYASNNPKVSIIAGSVGAATFGLLSIYLIAQNGAVLGALAAAMTPVRRVDFLLSSVAPHGVPEISGIIMAGAAGLLFGSAMLFPGRRTRADALKEVGADGVVLLMISIVLTLIAAPIEGFFSFNASVPGYLKTSVALAEIFAWTLFWTQYGKDKEASEITQIPGSAKESRGGQPIF